MGLNYATNLSLYILWPNILKVMMFLIKYFLQQKRRMQKRNQQKIHIVKYIQQYDHYWIQFIDKPPQCGIAGMIAYCKLLKRVQEMIMDDNQTLLTDRKQLIQLLLANKMILYNKLNNRRIQLEEKKDSDEKPLNFMENDLLERLKKVQGLFNFILRDIFILKQQNILQPSQSSLEDLFRLLFNERLDRKSEFIKLQYHIRNCIIKIVNTTQILKHNWKQEDLAKNQRPFIILDFFIFFFQLNALLISDESWINFQKQTQITKLVELPLTMNKENLAQIIKKIEYLKLFATQTKQKISNQRQNDH